MHPNIPFVTSEIIGNNISFQHVTIQLANNHLVSKWRPTCHYVLPFELLLDSSTQQQRVAGARTRVRSKDGRTEEKDPA